MRAAGAAPRMNTPLALHPVTGAIGAEIVGFDVAGLLRSGALADYAAALKAALHRHHVLFLRDQAIDRAGQKRLTALFGPLTQVPYVEAMADDPEVIAVLKEANEAGGGVFGGDWHSDFSFLAKPPAGSVLVAVEVPPFGGDTLWANQELALDTLPADLRRQIAGRDGIHSGKPYGVAHAPPPETQSGRSIKMTRGDPAADREQAHPLIRRHPGERRRRPVRQPDLHHPPGRPRRSGQRRPPRPPVPSRHPARLVLPLAVASGRTSIWDNRTTLHYAVNDYDGYRRLLYRTTFGDPPNAG